MAEQLILKGTLEGHVSLPIGVNSGDPSGFSDL
jgi:hypothetical protein